MSRSDEIHSDAELALDALLKARAITDAQHADAVAEIQRRLAEEQPGPIA